MATHGTGWHQEEAGTGRHGSISGQRWTSRRTSSPVQPLPEPVSPLGDETLAFVRAYEAAEQERRFRATRAALGGVVAGLAVRAYHGGRRLNPR